MDYKLNYLKYKKKYLNLKKLQSGGYYAKFDRCTTKKQYIEQINIFEGSKYKDETIILGKMIESFPEDTSIFYCHVKTQIIIISLSKLDETSKNIYRFFKKYNNIIVRIFSFEKGEDEQFNFVEYELNEDEIQSLKINSFLSLPTSIIFHGGENRWYYNSSYNDGYKNKIVIHINNNVRLNYIKITLGHMIEDLFNKLGLINTFNNTELPINFFFNIGYLGNHLNFDKYFLEDIVLKENFVKLYEANNKGDSKNRLIKIYVITQKTITVYTDTLEEEELKRIVWSSKMGNIDKTYFYKNTFTKLIDGNETTKTDIFLLVDTFYKNDIANLKDDQKTFKYFLERELINMK